MFCSGEERLICPPASCCRNNERSEEEERKPTLELSERWAQAQGSGPGSSLIPEPPRPTCANACAVLLSAPAGNGRQTVQSPGDQTPDTTHHGAFRRSVRVAAGGVNPGGPSGLEGEVTGQAPAAGEPDQQRMGASADLRPVCRAAGGLGGRRLRQEAAIKDGPQTHTFFPLKSTRSWRGRAERQHRSLQLSEPSSFQMDFCSWYQLRRTATGRLTGVGGVGTVRLRAVVAVGAAVSEAGVTVVAVVAAADVGGVSEAVSAALVDVSRALVTFVGGASGAALVKLPVDHLGCAGRPRVVAAGCGAAAVGDGWGGSPGVVARCLAAGAGGGAGGGAAVLAEGDREGPAWVPSCSGHKPGESDIFWMDETPEASEEASGGT